MKNNSLLNKGDSILIKIETPIVPSNTIVLGYFIHLEGVIDLTNIVKGEFAILPSSKSAILSENDYIWYLLDKQSFDQSEDIFFNDICNKQQEPYYLLFRFTKVTSYPQSITLTKISLKIANRPNIDGTYGDEDKYPFYEKSIFKKNNRLYATDNLKWTYNVLEKAKNVGIVATFIERTKDFSTFWEWICHCYAIIVNFARQFKYLADKEYLLIEYLKQKDVYYNTKISIFETLEILPDGSMRRYLRSTSDIFNIYEEFRERGTNLSSKKIKTLLESTSKDVFYSDYLPKDNSAWFLNKYSPVATELKKPITLLQFNNFNKVLDFANSILNVLYYDAGLSFLYFDLSENNEITIEFKGETPKSLGIYLAFKSSYLEEEIFGLDSLVLYQKVGENFTISYNKGYIFIKNINPQCKKISIPIRYSNKLFEKVNQGEFEDISSLGSDKVSYFVNNFIKIEDKKYEINKVAIRQIICYKEEEPNIFIRDSFTSEEKYLKDHILSIKLYNTKANTFYYIYKLRTSVTKGEDGRTYYNCEIVINETNSDKSVCSVVSSSPFPRDGYFQLDELNFSGITGALICSLNYEDINLEGINAFYIKSVTSEKKDYSFSVSYNFKKLPYNLNFLNPPHFWFNYIRNSSSYSSEKINFLINQKFAPYNAKCLILESDKVGNKILPLVFSRFEVLETSNSNLKTVICKVKGGIGPYEFLLNSSDGISVKKQNNGIFNKIPLGKYEIYVLDSVGTKIFKNNILLQDNRGILLEYTISNGEIFVKIINGVAPYSIHYSETFILNNFVEDFKVNSHDYTKLGNVPSDLNKDFYIFYKDSSEEECIFYTKIYLEKDNYIRFSSNELILEGKGTLPLELFSNSPWNIYYQNEDFVFNKKEGEGDYLLNISLSSNYTGREDERINIPFVIEDYRSYNVTFIKKGIGTTLEVYDSKIIFSKEEQTIKILGKSNAKSLKFELSNGDKEIEILNSPLFTINSKEIINGESFEDIGIKEEYNFAISLDVKANTSGEELKKYLYLYYDENTYIVELIQE